MNFRVHSFKLDSLALFIGVTIGLLWILIFGDIILALQTNVISILVRFDPQKTILTRKVNVKWATSINKIFCLETH